MAEWIENLQNGEPRFEEEWDIVYSCSSCYGSVIGNEYNYCPWCGEKITRTPKETHEKHTETHDNTPKERGGEK